jgi:hypothetical protein
MDWFRHDIYAHQDIKIRKLVRKYGYEAYGVYWFIVELLYENGGEMNLKDLTEELELIEKEDLLTAISELGLLSITNDIVSGNRILEEVKYQKSCKEKKSAAGKAGMSSRYRKLTKEQQCYNNDITVLEGCYNSVITEPNNVITEPNNVITDSNKGLTESNTDHIPTNQPYTNQPIKEKNNKKKFVPPTVQEIVDFCNQRRNGVDAQKVHDYYSSANWHDSRGEPIRNWKQKIIAVWERNNPKQTVCNDPSKMAADMNASGGFDL